MKINWGTAVVIAFGLFMSFILYFVFKVQSDAQYDNDLVVEKYYLKEQSFDKDMKKEQNAHDLKENVTFISNENGIEVTFPKDFDITKIKGKVSLYRPSNKKLDFDTQLSLSSPHLLIPKSNLVGGLWDISVDWTYEGKEYLSKKSIYF